MEPSRRVAFYRSAIPWRVALGVSLMFVFTGALVLFIERPLQMSGAIMDWVCIAFFGLGAVVFTNAIRADRRAPLLEIKPEGLTCPYSRFPLADVFFKAPTSERVLARTLDCINAAFAPEIGRYGVTIDGSIQTK